MGKDSKLCRPCGTVKALLEFHRLAKSPDGRQPLCKECSRQRKQAAYLARKSGVVNEDVVSQKSCSECKRTLDSTAFCTNFSNRDGKNSRCRECQAQYHLTYYGANREKVLHRSREQKLANRDRDKETQKRRVDRLRAEDPEGYARRVNEAAAKWRSANPEKVKAVSAASNARHRDRRLTEAREYQKLWRKANPSLAAVKDMQHRARRRRNSRCTLVLPFTAEQLAHRLSMFPACWMCGGTGSTADHVKPVVRGGAHILANLRRACQSCNSSKGSRWFGPKALGMFKRRVNASH